MAFYIELFDKNDKDNFIGYMSFDARTGKLYMVESVRDAMMFDDLERFKPLFDMNNTICGDYFINCCWDGNGEDPNTYYNLNQNEIHSYEKEVVSKKLIKKRERKLVKQIKKEIISKGRKRLDNLPQYVRWDVCNTIRCKRNIFTCLIYKDGKVTSTSAFTVYEAMQKVVQNHMKEKKMTVKEALAYLSTYNPDMERGFTMRKALNRSKVNREALGITC